MSFRKNVIEYYWFKYCQPPEGTFFFSVCNGRKETLSLHRGSRDPSVGPEDDPVERFITHDDDYDWPPLSPLPSLSLSEIQLYSEWKANRNEKPHLLVRFQLLDNETSTTNIKISRFVRWLLQDWFKTNCGRFFKNETGDKSNSSLCCLLSTTTAAAVRATFFSHNDQPNSLHD